MRGIEEVLAGVGGGRLGVRMPNWVGDAMLAMPALRWLRTLAPAARLELLARPVVSEVLGALDGPGDIVRIAGAPGLDGLRADVRALRGASAAILFPNSLSSAIAPWLARVPVRIGCRGNGRSLLLTHPGPRQRDGHQAARYRAQLGQGAPLAAGDGLVSLSADARVRGRQAAGDGPFVALVPGAAFGSAKRWPGDRFGELGRQLRAHGLEVVVLGTRSEVELAEGIARAAGGRSLAGRTDGATFAGILGQAALAVVNDSGALHLASALGTPAVAIFGATDPAATGPLGSTARVLRKPVPCSPCGLRHCRLANHECMEGITVEEAAAAALALIEASVAVPPGGPA